MLYFAAEAKVPNRPKVDISSCVEHAFATRLLIENSVVTGDRNCSVRVPVTLELPQYVLLGMEYRQAHEYCS